MNHIPLDQENIGKPGKYLLQSWGYHQKTTSPPIEVEIHEIKGFMGSIAFRTSATMGDGAIDDQIWRLADNYRLCVP